MKLVDCAKILRSKNSGPFEVTLDVLFDDWKIYEKMKNGGYFTVERIAKLYHIKEKDVVCIIFFDSAMGIKVTINRKISSGTCYDRDVYGAQQHAPLMEMNVDV